MNKQSVCLMHKMRLQCDTAVFQLSVVKGPCWHHRRLQRTTRGSELTRWRRWTQEQRGNTNNAMQLYHSNKSVSLWWDNRLFFHIFRRTCERHLIAMPEWLLKWVLTMLCVCCSCIAYRLKSKLLTSIHPLI